MNRLILIGNGFDLAHGMKTRYYDFILFYLRNAFKSSHEKIYNDDLIEVTRHDHIAFATDLDSITSLKIYLEFLEDPEREFLRG